MIIKNDRTELDKRLSDEKADLFLLRGGEGSAAGRIYSFMEAQGGWDPWQHIFLITDLAALDASEKQKWFGGNASDGYAVLRGKTRPKKVVRQGSVSGLLDEGEPDILKITDAFIAGIA